MSIVKELADSVDNGLKIATFIQENREKIQQTYGRSAITEPSSKDRIAAWESFIETKIKSDTGLQRDQEGPQDIGNGIDSDDKGHHNKESRPLSPPENALRETTIIRDYDPRYDNDIDISGESDEGEDRRDSRQADRGGHTHMEGDVASKSGGGSDSGIAGSDDGGATGGSMDTTDERDTETHGRLSVKEVSQDDLDQLLEETKPLPPRRIKNINVIREITDAIDDDDSPVKKTTEENSASTQVMKGQPSGAGATHTVQRSQSYPESKNASAGGVLKDVHSASTTMTEDEHSFFSDSISQDIICSKLDEVLTNQKKILEIISAIPMIKEEISGIKKILTNQSVALSTLDSYISDMMIIIPKSGVETDNKDKPVNPDLRPVIGRDHTRGRKEITKPYQPSEKIVIDENFYVIPEVDEKYITQPIDNNTNNAANFLPSNDLISIQIIHDIIDTEISDPSLSDQLHDLVSSGEGEVPVREIYKSIRSIIESLSKVDTLKSDN